MYAIRIQLAFAFALVFRLIAGVQSHVRALLEVSAGDCVGGCTVVKAGPTGKAGPGVGGLVVARRNRSERGSNEHNSPPDSARANSYIALIGYSFIFSNIYSYS